MHRAAIPQGRLGGAWRLAVLAGLAVAAACERKPAAPPAPQPVGTLTMRPQPTALTQEYPAQLEASNTVEIRPQVGGIPDRPSRSQAPPGTRGTVAARMRHEASDCGSA